MLKLGLDLHGCINKYPEKFITLAETIKKGGGQVWIITGSQETPALHEELRGYHFHKHKWWDHIFSISDFIIHSGIKYTYNPDGSINADPQIWDKVKGTFVEEMKIDFHIDDSPEYGKYFPQGIYLKFNDREKRDGTTNA